MVRTTRRCTPRTWRIRNALNGFLVEETIGRRDNSERIEAEFGRAAIPILIADGLSSRHAKIRRGSLWTLFHKFDTPPSARRAIRGLLQDPNTKVRWYAVWAYGSYKGNAIDALSILIELLKDRDFSVREKALETIGEIGPKAARAVEPIIALVERSSARTRRGTLKHDNICHEGVKALGNIRAKPRKTVPLLRKLLDHPDSFVRCYAMEALAAFGRNAVPALEDMILILKANDARQYSAGTHIAALGERAFPALVEALTSVPELEKTIRGLKEFGEKRSAQAILERVRAGKDFSPELASEALVALGPEAVSVAVANACLSEAA